MQNEQENVELLQSMMGGLDADVARRVLIKHKGDIQAAASAILEGDRGDESAVSWPMDYNADSGSGSGGGPNVPRRPNTPRASESSKTSKEKGVIDLTKETGNYDQDLSRALQMSLENAAESTSQNDPVLRPSDRVPDPSWAMVPSNVPSSNVQEQEDQSLSRAIEASLSTSFTEDKYEDLPQEERIRKPGHPVALRTKTTELYFATLVLQALFYVPQVRERLARWRPKQSEGGLTPALGSPEYLPYALQGLFTFLDLVLFSYINIDGLGLESHFKGRRATSASDLPGELSNSFYSHVANSIESQLWCEDSSNRQWERLFHLRHAPTGTPLSGDVSSQSNALGIETTPPLALTRGLDISCVRVDIFGSDGTNDLLSCLSSQLGLEDPPDIPNSPIGVFAPQPQSLVSPSDVIAFELARPLHVQSQTTQNQVQTVAQAPADVNPFRYPMYVYLDQFLRENASLAAEKRTVRKKMQSQLQELIAKRESLNRFEGKDTLNSLSSALHYYENIATKEGLPSRAEEVKSTAISLRKILTKVENEVQNLEGQISRLRSQTEKIFDDPLLQKHRYELRAVLVHDGLFGRNHIHSFVQHAGRWWKTQDASVIEVSEEVVLTDNTGLHLNAGPYMLIYSRATEEVELKSLWPTVFKNNAKIDNSDFLDALAPETAASIRSTYVASPLFITKPLQSESNTVIRGTTRSPSSMSVQSESNTTIRGPSRSPSSMSLSEEAALHKGREAINSTDDMEVL